MTNITDSYTKTNKLSSVEGFFFCFFFLTFRAGEAFKSERLGKWNSGKNKTAVANRVSR